MWGQALDTAIGLTFIFAITALFCSALVEAYATWTERRARYLVAGLVNMLDSPVSETSDQRERVVPTQVHEQVKQGKQAAEADDSLTVRLFDQHMLRALQTRRTRPGRDGKVRNPQYIPSSVFATALVSTLTSHADPKSGAPTARHLVGSLREGIDKLGASPVRGTLLQLLDQADQDLEKFRLSLQDWYDAEMGRISGWYKRWARQVLFVVGMLVATVANIDTVSATHTLWVDAPVRAAIVAQATSGNLCAQETGAEQRQACADRALEKVGAAGVPIGPAPGCPGDVGACLGSSIDVDNRSVAVLLKLLGIALTGVAVSFGAPFWFDALSRLGNLRSSGPKPHTGS